MSFSPRITLKKLSSKLRRSKDYEQIKIGCTTIRVSPHWFWKEYRTEGFELATQLLINKYVSEGSTYVDIGTWVGLTIMWAALLKPARIIGLDANPDTLLLLSQTRALNIELLKNVSLDNKCITDRTGEIVSFGSPGGQGTSSTSAMFRDSCYSIETISLIDFLTVKKALDYSLMKIDIEGAELYLSESLIALSEITASPILLALHPPFWQNYAPKPELLFKAFEYFDLFSLDEKLLSVDSIIKMASCEDANPPWGTKFGNFFDILIKPKT